MTIKLRLLLLSALGVLTIVLLLIMGTWYDRATQDHTRFLEEVNELVAEVESMAIEADRFLLSLDLSHQESFLSYESALSDTLSKMEAHSDKELAGEVQALRANGQEFKAAFLALVAERKKIGLTPKSGLYGQLRSAVHDVESVLKEEQDYRMLADMLQLRRNEKDFMLRLDMKYLQRFKSNIEKFKESISLSITFSPVQQAELNEYLGAYQTAFEALVQAELKVGLSASEGIRARLMTAEERALTELKTAVKMVKEKNAQARSQFMVTASVIAMLLVLLFIALTAWISSGIRSRIHRLQSFMGSVVTQKDLALRASDQGQDEIAEMSQALNQLLDMFQQLVSEVNLASSELDQTVEQLSQRSVRASEGAKNQLTHSELVATAATQMGQTVREIASNTETAAEHAQLTFDDASKGKDEVNHSVALIQALADKLNHASGEVSELAEQSQTIGDVLSVIQGIAEQTNLLALNAAIEAARAGEMGRGFAVVADEVRSLATRTQDSTEEIATIIGGLQSKTKSITELMTGCQTSGQEGAAQVTQVGEVLARVVEAMSGILQLNTEIAAATDQQSQVSNEVSEKVQTIRDIAQNTSSVASNNVAAAREVGDLSHRLRQQVSDFNA